MNFYARSVVIYIMCKAAKIRFSICLILSVAVCVAAACMVFVKSGGAQADEEKIVLKIWQIDSFEGGKGSRADFLVGIGGDYSQISGCYVTVVSLSAEAARDNLAAGVIPDAISYGAGVYGLESFITSYTTWCYGGYCLLSLDANADFSDANAENTVINAGKENLVGAAALFCGLQNAPLEKSTTAYVSLIGGGYKYLLGTQRDIYRLKTRRVSFSIKPVTAFNDLYQNISVTAQGERAALTGRFIDYLSSRANEVSALGLLANGAVYEDEMREMQGLTYDYTLTTPVSKDARNELESAVSSADINMLKNLLK